MGSIHRHVMVRLVFALAAGGLLLGLATYEFTRQEMADVFDEQLKQLALSVRTHYRGDVSSLRVAPASAAEMEDSGLVTQIWNLDQQRVFLSFAAADIPWVDKEGYHTLETRQGAWRVYAERSPTHLFQAAQLMSAREELALDTAVEVLLPNLAATLALIALLLAFALRRGLAPLRQTSADIGRRSASSLEPITTATLPAELKPLVEAINALMARLSVALATQRSFTAEAAHELRTPLTALRLQVQLLDKATDTAMRGEAMADMRHGLDRCTHLVDQLLQLARLAPDAIDRPSGPVDLALLVKSVVADFSALARSRAIDLGADVQTVAPGSGVVRGDEQHLRILLNNLVENALRYTQRGGRVDVTLRAAMHALTLEVADSGPGIDPGFLPHVFERFRQGVSGTTRAHGGMEIGRAHV